MVVLNRIYTRTGDDGTTALGSGERRAKHDLRIAAYGTVDELNATIGLARLHTAATPQVDAMLARIQNDLFDLGADLSTPNRPKGPGGERPSAFLCAARRQPGRGVSAPRQNGMPPR